MPSLAWLPNEAREGFVMATVAAHRTNHQNESHRTKHQNGFCAVAEPFVQGQGLPFTEVLDAESIQRVFREENALFGQDDIFSTQIVLWAFLAQTLRDGKGATYSAAASEIATSAAVHEKQPRRLGFTLACQSVLASWMLMSTGSCSNSRAMHTTMLAHIAANEVANRPGRIEPRVLKRRRHRYPLMQRPREQLRSELGKT